MKTYKIKLGLPDWESEPMEIEAENWEEVCNEIFGKLDIQELEN